ncbi:DUF2442 domain-containing protein [Bifidobacterium catulorum]|uniref:DUF2442 domain-containing protein n=1 Tax=Bifidobacterium catulorum TaxID=1630173 RepID=A0A2U2MTW0_9BIFI|nr:DUF2442 domain-containing protein [Bifidobacterium catulorum]PWG60242.1 DUF2442 domain-containing protein [Bifidobacterium catulorum]
MDDEVVTDAVPMGGHRVAVRFRDGFAGVMDMSRYLEYPAYASLADPRVFATARAVDGTIGWCDGNIDVAPEVVREEAVAF